MQMSFELRDAARKRTSKRAIEKKVKLFTEVKSVKKASVGILLIQDR